jgi:hypothetical protein
MNRPSWSVFFTAATWLTAEVEPFGKTPASPLPYAENGESTNTQLFLCVTVVYYYDDDRIL